MSATSGLTDQQLAALVSLYQILNALLEAGGWALPPDGDPSGGVGDAVGDASLETGNATALGVNTGTSITQNVNAKAEGGTINSSQNALVANVGLGVANTGGNVVAGVATGRAQGGRTPLPSRRSPSSSPHSREAPCHRTGRRRWRASSTSEA